MKWSGKIVELYDLWWRRDTEAELPFWKNVTCEYFKKKRVKDHAPCIVELFSGTGRILIPVAQYLISELSDFQLKAVGLDFSAEMNAFFSEKVSRLDEGTRKKASFVTYELDLSSKDWTKVLGDLTVDIFIIPFNHLGLIGDPQAQENIVRNVSNYLVQGGLFILVDYNPQTRREEDKRQEKLFKWITADENNNRVLFNWRKSNPLDLQHRYAQITYCIECVEWKDGGLHVESFPMSMIIYYNSPEELDVLLSKYGLKVEKRLGGPKDIGNGKPDFLEKQSHSQTVIARKT